MSAPGHLWAFSFSVEPSRIELMIPAGKQRGKTVRVTNTKSDAPIHVKLYAQDVRFLPDGTSDFPDPGSTAWSCARWVTFVPEELDVPAGQSREVRVSVAVPAGGRGGAYAMLFFETGPSYQEQGLGVNFRIGALIQVTIPKTEVYQAKLVDFAWTSEGVRLEMLNEGNLLIRPKGKVKIFDAQEKKIAQEEFNPERLGVLPQTSRTFLVRFGRVKPGRYHVKAEIDYGTQFLLVGELPVDIP